MIMMVNLNLMITRNCNLKCTHCLRGDSANEDISDFVLNDVFRPKTIIRMLQLNGGEVFSRPKVLKQVIDTIIKNRVVIDMVVIPTNGTLFTPEIELLLDHLNSYLTFRNLLRGKESTLNVNVNLSKDLYHTAELEKVKTENSNLYHFYMRNIHRLLHSRYFAGERTFQTLISAGRAKNLKEKKKAPTFYEVYYCNVMTPYGEVFEVNHVGIDICGTVCNTCGEMPPPKNAIYGNIREESLKDIIKRIGTEYIDEQAFAQKYQDEVESILEDREEKVLKK